MGNYYIIYKPHFKYSDKYTSYVSEHRYIMYIYLSILNNKVTYLSKDYDVHHINGNKKDNRIENLELLRHGDHSKITIITNPEIAFKKINMSNRFCNLCESKTTIKCLRDKKYYDIWYNDINGHLCSNCYDYIRRYKK
jgi:hypothetical protein